MTPRWAIVLTAVKRHGPQQTCPHGVSVAFVGGKKQMGQEYADSGSRLLREGAGGGAGGGEGGRERCSLDVDATVNSVGESMINMGEWERLGSGLDLDLDPDATVNSDGASMMMGGEETFSG
jgi:hypothetical protein